MIIVVICESTHGIATDSAIRVTFDWYPKNGERNPEARETFRITNDIAHQFAKSPRSKFFHPQCIVLFVVIGRHLLFFSARSETFVSHAEARWNVMYSISSITSVGWSIDLVICSNSYNVGIHTIKEKWRFASPTWRTLFSSISSTETFNRPVLFPLFALNWINATIVFFRRVAVSFSLSVRLALRPRPLAEAGNTVHSGGWSEQQTVEWGFRDGNESLQTKEKPVEKSRIASFVEDDEQTIFCFFTDDLSFSSTTSSSFFAAASSSSSNKIYSGRSFV